MWRGFGVWFEELLLFLVLVLTADVVIVLVDEVAGGATAVEVWLRFSSGSAVSGLEEDERE